MAIGAEQIKELRDRTGVSVMQCKKALEEAGGDMEKALVILRKNSKSIAEKKADRVFGSGAIASYVHTTGTVGVLVELVCETDFVSKNDEFKALARDIAMQAAATNPEYLKADEIPAEVKKNASEVFEQEVKGKPEQVRVQIIDGKMKSYFKERILLEQDFIKNPEVTVGGLIDAAIQKFGEKIEIARFVRYSVLGK